MLADQPPRNEMWFNEHVIVSRALYLNADMAFWSAMDEEHAASVAYSSLSPLHRWFLQRWSLKLKRRYIPSTQNSLKGLAVNCVGRSRRVGISGVAIGTSTAPTGCPGICAYFNLFGFSLVLDDHSMF